MLDIYFNKQRFIAVCVFVCLCRLGLASGVVLGLPPVVRTGTAAPMELNNKDTLQFRAARSLQLIDWSVRRKLTANYIDIQIMDSVFFPSKKVKHLLVQAS